MAKKTTNYTAKDAQKVNIDLVDGITEATAATPKKSVKKESTKKEVPQNRFTARFNDKEWAYLQEKHWQDRRPITDILREYVQADMKKHPEVLANADELTNPKNLF